MRPSLPTLRSKIFRSFTLVILLYGILGAFLVGSVLVSSGTTPKVIHINYDSIAAAHQLKQAWNGMTTPSLYSQKSMSEWNRQFEKALSFAEGNVTEPGELELVQRLRSAWEKNKSGQISPADFHRVDELLDSLIAVNEKGMFATAHENTHWSEVVLVIALLFFLASLALAFLLADNLASRLSNPIKRIVETLHERHDFGKKLARIEPNSLELLILTTELDRLWKKTVKAEQVNIEELLSQNARLDAVLESVEDALLVLDSRGNVTHTNTFLQRVLGLPAKSIIGMKWTDLPTLNENYLHLRALFEAGIHHSQEVDLLVPKHGTPPDAPPLLEKRHFAARWRKIAQNHSSGTLYLLHDISQKKQKDQLRAEVMDLLSHELKTPLQSLGTASEILTAQKENLPEEVQPLIDTIAEDVERIRAVAHEYVQVSQTHSKIMKLKLTKVPINQLIGSWLKPFMIVAKDRDVKVELLTEGSEVIYAEIDPVKFPWVISNLVSNAIRFSPKQAVVQVLVTDRNQAIEIKVKDEGPGIPPEDRSRIFEPYYQAKHPSTETSRGLFGVGLTIAKEVVEAHDGRIEYHPRESHGSVFRILLPFPSLNLG